MTRFGKGYNRLVSGRRKSIGRTVKLPRQRAMVEEQDEIFDLEDIGGGDPLDEPFLVAPKRVPHRLKRIERLQQMRQRSRRMDPILQSDRQVDRLALPMDDEDIDFEPPRLRRSNLQERLDRAVRQQNRTQELRQKQRRGLRSRSDVLKDLIAALKIEPALLVKRSKRITKAALPNLSTSQASKVVKAYNAYRTNKPQNTSLYKVIPAKELVTVFKELRKKFANLEDVFTDAKLREMGYREGAEKFIEKINERFEKAPTANRKKASKTKAKAKAKSKKKAARKSTARKKRRNR